MLVIVSPFFYFLPTVLWRSADRHTFPMWPRLPHALHDSVRKRQKLSEWLVLPHRKHLTGTEGEGFTFSTSSAVRSPRSRRRDSASAVRVDGAKRSATSRVMSFSSTRRARTRVSRRPSMNAVKRNKLLASASDS